MILDNKSLVRDPELRRQIWDYLVNERDEICRAYIKAGPFQPILDHYNKSGRDSHKRNFRSPWFQLFPTWLEYSPTTDAAYCLHCFLFSKPTKHLAATAFTVNGFKSWRKVRNGDNCCAFRGPDESSYSINHGNFLELLELLVSSNEKVRELVLDNAPKNACYISPDIQKEILQLFATRVKSEIHKEIGDVKFCIIVDKAHDESKKEQMAIVLRFVDQDGIRGERFFGVVHVSDTAVLTFKKSIYFVLSNHNLDTQNIRGQDYDGASNIRDIFYAAIDSQLQELNNRFNEQTIELIILSTTLEPREGYEYFRIDDICKLIVLVLTLMVSTATTERSFSAMLIVKTRIRNKMKDDFFTNFLIMYIEREIAEKLSIDSTINAFGDLKKRRVSF
ncbi:hypothetical protein Ddye_028716 [Dipteronia dyeriana]|uniref:TTF-type domain-containing protein n=1 Tax=Dipteronia dyeriana TaxID=168575 RepID=A0AAD9TD35_9ROSI|nr:hypothetical protein Ddye_028716 [Dipteronia dyeriana]